MLHIFKIIINYIFLFKPKISEIERRMLQRDNEIQDIKENMNSVEDTVYASFCKKIGVANIRQYEERELVMQQDRAKKRAEFEQQIDRINSRLDFEKSKDTLSLLKNFF